MWVGSYSGYANQSGNAFKLHVYSTSGEYIKSFTSPGAGNYYGLAANYSNNTMWYVQRNSGDVSSSFTLVKINLTDGSQTSYAVPYATGNIGDFVYGNDGKMWLSYNNASYTGGFLKVDSNGTFTSYAPPTAGITGIAPGLDGNAWMVSRDNSYVFRLTPSGTYTTYSTPQPTWVTSGSDGNIWFTQYGSVVSKIGTGVSTSSADSDGDGLNASNELIQGTSDSSEDTDRDGLSDFVESTSNPDHNALFCNSDLSNCEYPSPTQRDMYTEIDWMDKPAGQGYSSDAYSMKPSTSQINALKSSYLNKGIIAHYDTGQLGGGNQVPFQWYLKFEITDNAPDFYDYKFGGDGIAANFSTSRYHVYHYMLMGYQYLNNPQTSGVAYPGDDDAFIAYGGIKDTFTTYNSFDTAIAGTMMHEAGHNLCLTGENNGQPYYPEQPATCRSSSIESNAGNAFPSVMNYDKQLLMADYSKGSTTTNDHDDWSAIRLHDFANQESGDPTLGVSYKNKKKIKRINAKPIVGPTNREIIESRKQK